MWLRRYANGLWQIFRSFLGHHFWYPRAQLTKKPAWGRDNSQQFFSVYYSSFGFIRTNFELLVLGIVQNRTIRTQTK